MRVLLIEDHPIVRAGCRRLLEQLPAVEIVEASAGAEGLRINAASLPDTIILDLNLPDASGLSLVRELLAANPAARIVVFSMYEDPALVQSAIDAGAMAFVAKSDNPEALIEAIEKVVVGEMHLGAVVARKLALMNLQPPNGPLQGLTAREREALRLLADGRTLAEIAEQMSISYRSAANLVSQLKGKLGVSSNAALIRLAVEHLPSGSRYLS